MCHLNTLRNLAVIVLLAGLAGACVPQLKAPGNERATTDAIDARVQAALEGNDAVRSVLFGVRSASRGFEYHAAIGTARAGSTEPIRRDHQFMIASITKTMVATRILQLSESGAFDLDDRLADLGVFPEAVIERLHAVDGTFHGARISIRQLLNHTSGLKDYLLDDRWQTSKDVANGVAPGSLAGIWLSHLDAYLSGGIHPACVDVDDCDRVLYPARQWPHWDAAAFAGDPRNREAGLLNFYLVEMADAAAFPPGEGSHYSDTNYLLLGLVIEALGGTTLDEQLRSGIFEPLHMDDTYVSYTPGQEFPSARVSDWYALNVPMISSGADISWDWAGGGVVTTTADLLAFIESLMTGELFTRAETLAAMLQPIPLLEKDGELLRGYGLGISFSQTHLGPRWGHGGAWGAQMYYFPEHDVAVVGTVNDYGSGQVGDQLAMDIATAVVGE